MKPKLSIIIPCYNCESTLREAVDSCYKQGFSDNEFEIVMIDDGSTDKSQKLIRQIGQERNNIKVLFQNKNIGGGATRNKAVANTISDVIFCLDSDDLLPDKTLSKMYDYLIEKDADGVAFNHSVKFNGTNINDINYIDNFPYVDQKIPFSSLIGKPKGPCPLHVVFMYTKGAFVKAGGYPTDHSFDTQGFAWRFLANNLTAYTCPGATYLHRVNHHPSYYVREAAKGMVNFNWQKILLEHFNFLTEETQKLVISFNCSDFTRNLFNELNKCPKVFKDDYSKMLGKGNYGQKIKIKQLKPIGVNSWRGIFLRIKSKLKSFIKK